MQSRAEVAMFRAVEYLALGLFIASTAAYLSGWMPVGVLPYALLALLSSFIVHLSSRSPSESAFTDRELAKVHYSVKS